MELIVFGTEEDFYTPANMVVLLESLALHQWLMPWLWVKKYADQSAYFQEPVLTSLYGQPNATKSHLRRGSLNLGSAQIRLAYGYVCGKLSWMLTDMERLSLLLEMPPMGR